MRGEGQQGNGEGRPLCCFRYPAAWSLLPACLEHAEVKHPGHEQQQYGSREIVFRALATVGFAEWHGLIVFFCDTVALHEIEQHEGKYGEQAAYNKT